MIRKNKYENLDKQLLKYDRELTRLYQAKWNAPLVELERPYQNGWIKTFQLRDDISRRTDAANFRRILGHIKTTVFCRHKGFVAKNGEPIVCVLKVIGEKEWDNLKLPESYKKHFIFGYHNVPLRWDRTKTQLVKGYKFAFDYYFVDLIEPHFVTHQKIVMPEVESRIRYLSNFLDGRNYQTRLNKIQGRRSCGRWELKGDPYDKMLKTLGTKEIEEYAP